MPSTISTRPVAIVTGANKGLGLQVAKDLFGKGYSVVLACRDLGRARAAIEEVRTACSDSGEEAGQRLSAVRLDLADASTLSAAVEEFSQNHDRLDVLVNNAAILNEDDVKGTLTVNFFNTIAVTEAFLPLLSQPKPGKATKGRVVIVSSRMGCLKTAKVTGDAYTLLAGDGKDIESPKLIDLASAYLDGRGAAVGLNGPPYSTSKALVIGYGRSLAAKLAKEGVTVNAVCPGFCDTDMNGHQGPRSVKDGAETISWAASGAEFDTTTGKFLGDHQEISILEQHIIEDA